MNNIVKTNLITEYFIKKNIIFRMASTKYDLEKDGNNDHLIQFDFQVDGINDFSIFYYINDSGWFMSSIYELISPINSKEFNELKNKFQNNKGIFDTIFALNKNLENIEINENNKQKNIYAINLFIELDDKDFNINHLDKIYDYLINKTNFSKKLSSLSKIKNTK